VWKNKTGPAHQSSQSFLTDIYTGQFLRIIYRFPVLLLGPVLGVIASGKVIGQEATKKINKIRRIII
jgi:hypothetical protein